VTDKLQLGPGMVRGLRPLDECLDVPGWKLSGCRRFEDAMALCMTEGGVSRNEVMTHLGWDKGNLSRYLSGTRTPSWPRQQLLMRLCGNRALVQWQALECGGDLTPHVVTTEEKAAAYDAMRNPASA
jgi:Helix-turn-helix domain